MTLFLFLWVTAPLSEKAFQVVSAWGFEFKAEFIWDKVKHNMGRYNSVRHEKLYVCTRGSCPLDVIKLFDSVQEGLSAPNTAASPKNFATSSIRSIHTERAHRAFPTRRRRTETLACLGRQICTDGGSRLNQLKCRQLAAGKKKPRPEGCNPNRGGRKRKHAKMYKGRLRALSSPQAQSVATGYIYQRALVTGEARTSRGA